MPEQLLNLFGPLAAVALGLYLLFKWAKPRLERAEEEKDQRISDLAGELAAERDRLDAERKEKDEAKDAMIEAFGDIGDSFQQFADDLKLLVEASLSRHQDVSNDMYENALTILEQIRDNVNSLLDWARRHNGSSNTRDGN